MDVAGTASQVGGGGHWKCACKRVFFVMSRFPKWSYVPLFVTPSRVSYIRYPLSLILSVKVQGCNSEPSAPYFMSLQGFVEGLIAFDGRQYQILGATITYAYRGVHLTVE